MNERIKELAEQAEKLSLQYANKNNVNHIDAFNVVFAKLIVLESMMVVEGFTIEQEVALDQYEEYEASAVLKEHFGVEE